MYTCTLTHSNTHTNTLSHSYTNTHTHTYSHTNTILIFLGETSETVDVMIAFL